MVAAGPTLAMVVAGRRYPEPCKEFGEIRAGPEDIDNRDLHAQKWVMVLIFTDLWVRVFVYTTRNTLYITIILDVEVF